MTDVDRVTPSFCPVEGIPAVSSNLPETVSDLARRNISPDTFHIEERDLRWATLAACSPAQSSLFRDLQVDLSHRIGEMSTAEIADNLGRLFNKAYRHDPVSNTMDVADSQAKRKLDIWIAVIDHRAFQDKEFLDRILGQPVGLDSCPAGDLSVSNLAWARREIKTVMVLSSPNLNSRQRGTLYRHWDHSAAYYDLFIKNLAIRYFWQEDAGLHVELFSPINTISRLDGYRMRERVLSQFRELYRDFLKAPLAERFSSERLSRHTSLDAIMVKAKMNGLLVTIEDLDEIRKEVQREVGVRTSGPMTWKEFIARDPRQPLFIRPDELGGMTLADDSCAEPLALSSRMKINGSPLSDLVRDNVDFLAILPPELMPSQKELGRSYSLLRTIIFLGARWNPAVKDRSPSPGFFHGVLAHEAGHQVLARTNFNNHPDFLMRRATHELYAYLIESLAQESYRNTGCALPAEQDWLQGEEVYVDSIIRYANRRLGLGPDERRPRFTDPLWQGRPLSFFDFHPEEHIKWSDRGPQEIAVPDETPDPVPQAIGSAEEADLRRLNSVRGDFWRSRMISLSVFDQWALTKAFEQIRQITDQTAIQKPLTFQQSHPLVRVINGYLEERREKKGYLRELRIETPDDWWRLEVSLLRLYTSSDSACRMPAKTP